MTMRSTGEGSQRPFRLCRQGRGFNFLWLSVAFSVLFWLLEAVQHTVTFGRGELLTQVFAPDVMRLWTRVLVVCVLLLFGAYAQSIKDRIDTLELPKPPRFGGVFLSGLGFGLLYWLLESFRGWFIYERPSLLREIFSPTMMDFWMRILAISVILLFTVYVHRLIEARKRVEEELTLARDRLEQMVNARTTALMRANAQLERQIAERLKAEEALKKANRAFCTLSRCNEALIRATDEASLVDAVCRLVVSTGEFDLAWIGFFDPKAPSRLIPVARAAGDATFFSFADEMAASAAEGPHPPIQRLREGTPWIMPNLLKGDEGDGWYRLLIRHGFGTGGSFPLACQGHLLGAITLLSRDPSRFGEEEVALLQDLADDIAFGITALRTRIERQRSEEEKAKIQAQLLHSQKMEAVGLLAGGVAHDFNNLLTAIQVSTDLALMQIQETDPVYLELKEIHRVALHAASLAKQLLLFSRKHPMEFVALDLNTVINELKKTLLRVLGEEIQVETRLAGDLWNIWADRGTMEQVIMNLVLNAKDAMPQGGRLTLRTENVSIQEGAKPYGPESRPGQFVCLSVSDTGIGMDAETLSHIFEPFFSTKGPRKGTGLGLSVVYGIVHEHRGWIHVESALGNGSRFFILIPAVFAEVEGGAPETIDFEILKGNGERVLVVEDEARVREYTAKGLRQNNYRVVTVSTAADALSLFERENGNFDLLFSDVVLPDQSGVELAEQLLSKKPSLRIVLSSGYANQKSRWPSIEARGMRFLQKPYALVDLLKALKA